MLGLKLRSYDGALVLLGLTAVLALAFPFLTVVSLISIIGIPIAFVLMILPALAFVLIPARFVQRLSGFRGVLAVVGSIAAVLLVLAFGAIHFNGRLDTRVDAFAADDMDALSAPRHDTLAIAEERSRWQDRKQSACSELCMRLLLNGEVRRVVIFPWPEYPETLPPDVSGRGFWLERRSACPDVDLPDDRLGRAVVDEADAKSAAEQLRLKIVGGTCLLERAVSLSEIDTLLTAGRLSSGGTPFSAGLWPDADTVSADRVAVFQRDGTELKETYRRTALRWYSHGWILAPTIVGGYGLEMGPAFFRTLKRRNIDEEHYDGPDLASFLQDRLGLTLAIKAALPADGMAVIADALDQPGAIDRPKRKVIEDFFDGIDRQGLTESGKSLALRILSDPRIPAPRATYKLVMAMRADDAAANTGLARVLFERLAATPADQKEDHPTYLGWPAAYLANGIALLPKEAILAQQNELEDLARDVAKRRRAENALYRLSEFGVRAVPTSLYLLEDAARLRQGKTDSSDRDLWRSPYRAGLISLCRMGADGSSAIVRLTSLLRSDLKPLVDRDLVVETLISVGASEPMTAEVVGGFKDEVDRRRFGWIVNRAKSGKADCRT
jgi:hypothetical protein